VVWTCITETMGAPVRGDGVVINASLRMKGGNSKIGFRV